MTGLITTAAPPDYLKHFVDHDGDSKTLGAPFFFNGTWIAMNGKVMAYSATALALTDTIAPNLKEGIGRIMGVVSALEIPNNAVELSEKAGPSMALQKKCEACGGVGKCEYVRCDDCLGNGTCPHCDAECAECNGSGKLRYPGGADPCEDCEGSGKNFNWSVLNLFGAGIGARYLHLILKLGASIGRPVEFSSAHMGKQTVFPFRFFDGNDEVRGIVMPVSQVPGFKYDWPVIEMST